jgi:hypothetical protein
MIEIWFGILTKDVLKGGIWQSRKQLVKQLIEYIKTYNEKRAKPFEETSEKYDFSHNQDFQPCFFNFFPINCLFFVL